MTERSPNVVWQKSTDRAARWDALGHGGATVWMTGLPGSAWSPNSAPSNITRSNVASDSSAWNSPSESSAPSFARSAAASRSFSGPNGSSSAPAGLPRTWSRSTSISAACRSRGGTVGRNTEASSPRRRARTKRPTAWAKNSGVAVFVASVLNLLR